MRFKIEYRSFSSTVGVADTSTPSVGTRIQCLSNPSRFNYDNHQFHTIFILTVNMEINLCGMGCSWIALGRPEAVLFIQVRSTKWLLLYAPALDASTLPTSDWDMPNCRAMSLGLIPALNAARTALICPRVNESGAGSACRPEEDLSVRAERLSGLIGRR